MAKNSLSDLVDHLFERIEYVTDQDIKGKELDEEIKRSELVNKTSTQIVNIANTFLKAKEIGDRSGVKMEIPAMLKGKTT
jgi:hypothetical protein